MIGESNGSDSIIHVRIYECIMCIFIHSLSEEIWCFVKVRHVLPLRTSEKV